MWTINVLSIPKDYMTVQWYGKERQITDIGDKFKYLEETVYGQSTQPLYVLLDLNEKPVATPRGYNASIEDYIKWMDNGLKELKPGPPVIRYISKSPSYPVGIF